MPHDERRWKRIIVSDHFLVNLFNATSYRPEYVTFSDFQLPEGVRVIHSYSSLECRGVTFIIEHPSFEIVSQGKEIPILEEFQLRMRKVKLDWEEKEDARDKKPSE